MARGNYRTAAHSKTCALITWLCRHGMMRRWLSMRSRMLMMQLVSRYSPLQCTAVDVNWNHFFQKLRLAIEKAFSDYQKLDSGCEVYSGDLHGSDLYWAYKNAIDRQGRWAELREGCSLLCTSMKICSKFLYIILRAESDLGSSDKRLSISPSRVFFFSRDIVLPLVQCRYKRGTKRLEREGKEKAMGWRLG